MPRVERVRTFNHVCGHCGHGFPTAVAVRRHTAHSPRCHAAVLRGIPRALPADENQRGAALAGRFPEPDDLPGYEHGIDPADEDQWDGAGRFPDPDDLPGYEHGVDPEHQDVEDRRMGNERAEHNADRYAQEFDEGLAAEVLGLGKTSFEALKDVQDASGNGAYAPFADHDEWKLAEWLIENVNQQATEDFLKLSIVS